MTELISVIIPVYNGELFLERALDSMLEQTYSNLEVIIINDGSIDGTEDIIQKYSAEHPGIVSYAQNHAGVSAARNLGLSKAVGEWVVFLDADDYYLKSAIESLYIAQNNSKADMVFCQYFMQTPSGQICTPLHLLNIEYHSPSDSVVKINREALFSNILNSIDPYALKGDYIGSIYHNCWGRIFRKSIILEHGIEFDTDLSNAEDVCWVLEFLKYAESVGFLTVPLYARQAHISHKSLSKNMLSADIELLITRAYIDFFSSNNEFLLENKEKITSSVVYRSFFNLFTTFAKSLPDDRELLSDIFYQVVNSPETGDIYREFCRVENTMHLDLAEIFAAADDAEKLYDVIAKQAGENLDLNAFKRKREYVDSDFRIRLSPRDLIIEKLLRGNKDIFIYGAGVVGRKIMVVLRESGVNIAGFCEDNPVVKGSVVEGVEVFASEDILKGNAEAEFVISVIFIDSIVKKLQQYGRTWYAGGLFIYAADYTEGDCSSNKLYNENELLYMAKRFHEGFCSPRELVIPCIDIMITERCSLKCRECSNLMQYYERPHDILIEEVIAEINSLLEYADDILELRIIGGDAMMNRRWSELLVFALECDKIHRIVLYTNGIIPFNAAEFELINNPNVLIRVSDYKEHTPNQSKFLSELATRSVRYDVAESENWISCSTLGRNIRTTEQQQQVFAECCSILGRMLTITDNKLFRCPFAANAFRLKAARFTAGDYLDLGVLNKDSGKLQILEFINGEIPTPVCDYCYGRPATGQEIAVAEQTDFALSYKKYD